MHRTELKIPMVVSGIAILFVMLISFWFGYKNRWNLPAEPVPSDVSSDGSTPHEEQPDDLPSSSDTETQTGNPSMDNVSSLSVDPVSSQDDAEPVEEKVTQKFIRVSKATNVRSEDSDGSKLLSVLTKGSEAEIVSESKTRYQVKYSGNKTGWIIKSCGDVYEKEVVIKHIPTYLSGDPIEIKGTKEADDIADILKKHSTVGASVAVIKNGKVAYHYEYGYANKEKKVKVTENTKFRVASISKVFTSMLAMTEVDDGKLDLDGDLTDIMGYKFGNPSHSDKKVNMRMLLTHTSGLIDRDNEFSTTLKNIAHNGDYYVSPPGVKFLYCNLGIGIAGAVVEKSADQTISQYAGEKFFTPMGIDASYDAKYLSDKSLVADCYEAGKIKCTAKYLCRSQEKGKPGVTYHLGQGGLLISSVDLARVFTVLINDGQYNGKQYISQNSLAEMLKDQKVETGKGFRQCIGLRKSDKLVKNREMYFHNGSSYGIYSLAAFDTADNSGIVIITSGAFTNRNKNTVFAVCDEVMNYCYGNILK